MRNLKSTSVLAILLVAAAAGVQAQTVKATFNYPAGVSEVAVDYVANRAYVLLPSYPTAGANAVQVLDGSDNAVLATYAVPVANAIAVNIVTGTVYVAGAETTTNGGTESAVVAVNPKTGAVLATIPVSTTPGSGIVALAVDPFTNRVFVSNDTSNAINIISGSSNTLTNTVNLNGQVPNGIAVNFLTGKVYAALNNNQVAILCEENNKVTYATYGSQTSGVAVDPILDREYVTDGVFSSATVGVLNGKGATEASVSVGLFPQGVDADFVTSLVFVANEADGTVSKIDAQSNSVVSTTTVPANSLAVNPREGTVYVAGATSVTILSEN
jgi:DNA-binding beta-propeller fold protein YncE